MHKSGGISRKILAAVLLTTISLMGAWGIFEYLGEKNYQLAQLQKNSALIADRLTNSLIYPVWNLNDDEIEKTISYEMQYPEVQAIILVKDNGTLHSGKIKSKNGEISSIKSNPDKTPPYPPSFLTIHKPIIKFNETIGFVSLHTTDRLLDSNLRRFAVQSLLKILALSAVISSVIFFTLRRQIIKPLTTLEQSVSGISSDNLLVKIQTQGNDEITKLAHAFIDMTKELNYNFSKQERLLKELKERDERFSSIVSNVPGAIYRIKPGDTHKVHFISENIQEITGYPANAFVQDDTCNLRELIVDTDRHMVMETIENAILERRAFDINYRIIDAGGGLRWVRESGQPLFGNHETVDWLDGFLIDTTEIHSKDEQLRQSQKMETIGMIAGGIAHDFNNILTCIIGTTALLRMSIDLGEEIRAEELERDISTIDLAAERATELVRQILTLSMKQETNLLPCDLNHILKHIYKLCRSTVDRSVDISVDYADGDAITYADPVQIEQLLLNICVNAAHAMTIMRPETENWGGHLKISLSQFKADRFFCMNHSDAEERDYLVVSAEDTGIGMTKEILSQIFNPFFSTKEQGKGTGLGLSMVANIVKQHNGFINIYSEPGLGTTFHIYLPQAEPAIRVDTATQDVNSLPQGTGTILVVDDEDIIRTNTSLILEKCGYTVLLAENGEVAVEVFRRHAESIHLVLLDMVMPRLSGQEVFRAIYDINPATRILLSSGFKQDVRVQELLANPSVEFIHKPYTLFGLANRVHELIGCASEELMTPCNTETFAP